MNSVVVKSRTLVVAVLFFLGQSACIAASSVLAGPWDQKPVNVADSSPPACGSLPSLKKDLKTKGYYADKANSIADGNMVSEYSDVTAPFRRTMQKVVAFSDDYVREGDTRYAVCARRLLRALAADGVLAGKMQGHQAYYFRTWMLNAASISWLKIRSAQGFGYSDRDISRWLSTIAEDTIRFNEARTRLGHEAHNLRYWAGAAVMSTGIATERRDLFDWGVKSYDIGVRAIREDGSLPAESRRGRRALHYHIFASAPLVLMAELGEVNGLNMYSRRDFAILKLVSLSLSGLISPAYFEKLSGTKQDVLTAKNTDLSWLIPLANRFEVDNAEKMLGKFTRREQLYLGGMPPDWQYKPAP